MSATSTPEPCIAPLTWWCLDQGVELTDEAAVVVAAEAIPLELSTDPEDQRVS